MSDGQIVIEVIMDDKSVRSGTAKIDSSIGSLSRSGERASLSIGKIATSIGLVKVAGKAFDLLKSSVGSAVDRFDTLQKFPKVMESLGYSTEQSAKSSKKLSDGIEGLPTTLQDVVAHTQQMTSITGDLDKSTDTVLALNNAFLASGASTADAERGMQQYNQMLSTGQVDLMSWHTLQETMPLALQKTAEAMGFVGKSAQEDLYDALKNGTVTFDQFQDKLIQLGTGTGMLADLAKKNSLGIKTSFVNLRNSITKGLTDILTKFDEIIQKLTGKSIAQNIDSLKGIINNTFSVVKTGLGNLMPLFEIIGNFISKHIGLFKTLGVAVGTFVASLVSLSMISGTFSAIAKAFSMATNPLTLILAGLSALIAVVFHFYNTSKPFKAMIDGMVKSLENLLKPIDKVLKGISLLTKGFIEMVTNGPGKKIEELNSQFSKLFPQSLWQGMISFTGKINDLKLGIQAIGKIISGSIKNFDELDGFLSGAFSGKGEQNILKIGKAIKNIINAVENLLFPVKKAENSFNVLNIAVTALKIVFLSILGPVGLIIKAFELFFKTLGNGSVKQGINSILTSFEGLSKDFEQNAPKLGTSFGNALDGILTAIGKALPGIISGGLQIVAGFVSGVAQGLPTLALAAAELITAFTGAMLLLVPLIVTSATSIIVTFLGALTIALPQIIVAGAGLINALLQGIAQQLPTLITNVANLVVTWLTALNAHLPEILQAGINLLITFMQGIANNIGKITQQAINIIVTFAQTIVANMPTIVNTAVDLIVSFVGGLAARIPDIINAAVNLIVNFINGIANKIPDVVNAAMNLVDAMVQGVIQTQGRLMNAAITLINGFANNIRNRQGEIRSAGFNLLSALVGVFVPDSLVNAGAAIINGFLNGLKSGFERVKNFVGGIADWISKHKGPISYDKKLLITHGQAIMQSLNNGLVNGFQQVQDTISGIASELSDGVNVGLNVRASDNLLSLPKITPEAALGAYGQMASTSSIVNNYYTTRNNDGVHYQRPIIIENTLELDGRSLAKGTAKFTDEEIRRTTKLQNKIKGV